MKKIGRQAIDPLIVSEESKLLAAIWYNTPAKHRGSQAEFGERFEVGNQSAVGQFLRGESPLSMKAARGFAKGLGCQINAFSKRLAAEVDDASSVNGPTSAISGGEQWPFLTVTPEQYYGVLDKGQRDIVEAMVRTLVGAREPPIKHPAPANNTATKTSVAKTA
jgi:hypothetical protein